MAEDEISFDPNDVITNIEMVSADHLSTEGRLCPLLIMSCLVSRWTRAGGLVSVMESLDSSLQTMSRWWSNDTPEGDAEDTTLADINNNNNDHDGISLLNCQTF